jgi:flagellar biosynthesis/type III secretory pathway protein FliH
MASFSLWSGDALVVHTDSPVLLPAELAALLDMSELAARCEAEGQALIEKGQQNFDAEVRRGYEHGLALGAAACAERLLGFERERAQWLAERHRQVVELVELVLDRIAPALAEGKLVRTLAHQAVLDARHAQRLLVKVHPALVAGIQSDLDDLRRTCPWLDSLEVLGDDSLARDDCLLESPHGFIHAHWQTQLAAVRAVLGDLAAMPEVP